MKASLLLSITLSAATLRAAECFTPLVHTTPTMALRLPSLLKPKSSSRLRVASTAADDNLSTRYLREIEKKEAILAKRREEAMAKLNEYDVTLNKLSERKAEYLAATQLAETPPGGSFSETALRSVVKAFAWRFIAACITFATTLKFSGSISAACQVVTGDFLSKMATMFIGERLMNKSQAGRKAGSDAASRSLAKALIWRLFAIFTTLVLAIFVSKDMNIAAKVASTDAVIKTTLMFVFERVWARVEWGKEYLVEFAI
jgi:uncharacterized membrane protein